MSIRRFAIPASKGSVAYLNRLLDLLETLDEEDKSIRCLPVLYANLDPTRIPMKEETLHTDLVACAKISLCALSDFIDKVNHKSMLLELWQRVWAWTVFFDAYGECLQQLCLVEPIARWSVCFDLASLVGSFTSDEATMAQINQTVGVRALVMEAWAAISKSDEWRRKHTDWAFYRLCCAIGAMSIETDRDFKEVMDRVGGGAGLGNVIVKSLKLLLGPEGACLGDEKLKIVTHILVFLQNLGNTKVISRALMQNRGAEFLTLAAAATLSPDYKPKRAPLEQRAVLLCLNTLHYMLSCHRAMRDSIAGGLLQVVLSTATILPNTDPSELQRLRHILTRSLPESTAFQTVLVEMERQLRTVKGLENNIVGFERSWIHDDWRAFTALADDRIDFMNSIQSKNFKTCDNMEKDVRGDANFLIDRVRVSLGLHGERRQPYRGVLIGAQLDRLCLGDLEQRDTGRDQLCEGYSFITVMDYRSQNGPLLYTEGLSWMMKNYPSYHIRWEEHIARMRQPHGRIELHLVIVDGGIGTPARLLMFPYRPSLHENVRRISQAAGNHMQEDVKEAR
ncbi:hypothetical protein C8R45DRAFT_1148378 [Mycena sanguinolenta]|nr:hypothetical protein C8R45DRAFT_1148378 [Mycena sanguinolenta]